MEATQEQARIAQETLVAANRPWLTLADVKPASLASCDEAGVTLWINIVAKNVGRSPAQNVSVSARLLIVENSGPRPDLAMDAVCQKARESPIVVPGEVVFPDRTEDINTGTPHAFTIFAEEVWAAREARMKSLHAHQMAKGRPEWAEAYETLLSEFPFHAPLYFVGCVNYRSSDNKMVFQTGFMFSVTGFMFSVSSKPSGNGFPLLGGTPPVVRHPKNPARSIRRLWWSSPCRMQRTVDGEQIELGRPLYATFAR